MTDERPLSDAELDAICYRVKTWSPEDPSYGAEGMICDELPRVVAALRLARAAILEMVPLDMLLSVAGVTANGPAMEFSPTIRRDKARRILRALGKSE